VVPHALRQVHRADGRRLDAADEGRGRGRQEPERQEGAAKGLRRPSGERVLLAGTEPNRLEVLARRLGPVAAEPPDELLEPVDDEERAPDDAKRSVPDPHSPPPSPVEIVRTTEPCALARAPPSMSPSPSTRLSSRSRPRRARVRRTPGKRLATTAKGTRAA